MKFGQVIEYNTDIFFNNHTENEGETLVLDLFLFFKNALYKVKGSLGYLGNLGQVSLRHFVNDVSRKMFVMLYSTN